jgi:5-methylcytosine-specific restriction endonuclease McrA
VPTSNPIEVYETCVAAVDNATLQQKYSENRLHMVNAVDTFDAATAAVSWASLPRVPRGNPSVLIAGSLTKKDLVELYKTYMVGATGPSRKIYDDILVAGGGLCPFCGGLGIIYTLDHYLPKSNFPLYSILPSNLVPCCRDCNTGKNSTLGAQNFEQTLHPYLDDDKYFQQRWVSAEVFKTDPVVLKFRCFPPEGWSELDKLRVHQHFKSYKFGYRFSVQAGAELARVVDLRSKSLRVLPRESFRAYLVENANSAGLDLNGWSRTMYAALAETEWFLGDDFTNPAEHLV